MAIVYFDTWDYFDVPGASGQSNLDQINRIPAFSSHYGGESPRLWLADGPFGEPSISLKTTNYRLTFPTRVVTTAFLFACWIKSTAASWNTPVLDFFEYGETNRHCRIRINASAQVEVQRGTTTLATSTLTVPASGTWNHFAVKYNIHDSTGAYEVKVNGTSYVSGTGADTKEGSGNSEIASWGIPNGLYEHQMRYSLPVLWNTSGDAPTDFMSGLHKTYTLRASADTAQEDWTAKSAGNNFDEVKEAEADDDTSYNYTSTATDKDRLAVGDLPETPAAIYAVQARTLRRQTGAGAHKLKTGLYSGTTEAASAAIGVGIEYMYDVHLTTLNPDDSAVWEEADVNAAQVQYEASA